MSIISTSRIEVPASNAIAGWSIRRSTKAKGTPAVYGDTKMQTLSALATIEKILKAQGLTMGDVVQMDVFLAPDPATGKMDFAGMNEAYSTYFGTAEQPNKPVRAAMQVAALATSWGLVEIQVVAVKSK